VKQRERRGKKLERRDGMADCFPIYWIISGGISNSCSGNKWHEFASSLNTRAVQLN
jgi:hypothetical protein